VSGLRRKAPRLRQINTTGNLRMAELRDLPVGATGLSAGGSKNKAQVRGVHSAAS
jgi:hypothetical protein